MTEPPPTPLYGAVDLPDCWGVDAAIAGALTDEELRALVETPLPSGQPIKFLWGYVPLPGNVSRWDMTAERLRAACDAGLVVLLVQHCRSGMTVATEEQGVADGEHAAAYVTSLGYPRDAHVAHDDEAVSNAGAEVAAREVAWCDRLRVAALPCVYEGFSPGLTPEQEFDLPNVDRYWGAFGRWDVAVRGVCCRQGKQIVLARTGPLAGIPFDPDHAFADKLGGVLRGMARLDLHPELAAAAPTIPIPDTAHRDTEPPGAAT